MESGSLFLSKIWAAARFSLKLYHTIPTEGAYLVHLWNFRKTFFLVISTAYAKVVR